MMIEKKRQTKWTDCCTCTRIGQNKNKEGSSSIDVDHNMYTIGWWMSISKKRQLKVGWLYINMML